MLTTRLSATAKPHVLRHYLALSAEDRRLRFGGALADSAIESYVRLLDPARDALFGVVDDEREIVGVAHVPIQADLAELGISVLPQFRRRGIGTALVSRAANHARAAGIARLCMICLAENATMLRIAKSLGMQVVNSGVSAHAVLALLPQVEPTRALQRSPIDLLTAPVAPLRQAR